MCFAMDNVIITDCRLSRSLIVDINPVIGLLHSVLMGDDADVSEVHAASIFRVDSENGGGQNHTV
jgi:hypothetical protein